MNRRKPKEEEEIQSESTIDADNELTQEDIISIHVEAVEMYLEALKVCNENEISLMCYKKTMKALYNIKAFLAYAELPNCLDESTSTKDNLKSSLKIGIKLIQEAREYVEKNNNTEVTLIRAIQQLTDSLIRPMNTSKYTLNILKNKKNID